MAASTASNSRAIVPVLDDGSQELRAEETVEAADDLQAEQAEGQEEGGKQAEEEEEEEVSHPVDLRVHGQIVHRETMVFTHRESDLLEGEDEAGRAARVRANLEKDSVFSAFNNAVVSEEYEDSVKYESGWRLELKNFMLRPDFTVVVMLLTLYAVVGLSISEAACGYKDFDALTALTLVSMIFFSLELIALCLCNKEYYKTFYFWLDFIGTVSLWPDVKWIWPGPSIDGLAVARAARIARAGTKAVRAVRFFRVLRLVRVIRVLKFVKIASRSMSSGGSSKNANGDDVGAGAGKIARKHAETVEMRVVLGTIVILIVVTNLEYATPDMSTEVALKTMRNLYETVSDSAAWRGAAKVFSNKIDSLVYLKVGDTIYEDHRDDVTYRGNIVYTKRRVYGSVTAGLDVTEEIQDRALFDILLTLFLMLLFVSGAYIFNRDATKMVVEPLSKLSERITTIASDLFAIKLNASETMNDTAALESILTKVVRVFQTTNHKITTLYHNATIWTITVHKEQETALKSGVGTSHRLDVKGIQTLQSPSNASKKAQVRNFMFNNFINDPMAFKHFETFLAKQLPELGKHLHFWEEVQRFKRSARDSTQLAEDINTGYMASDAEDAIAFPPDILAGVKDGLAKRTITPETFDSAIRFVEDALRGDGFHQFVDHPEHMQQLIRAKSGPQKAIMFENEYEKEGGIGEEKSGAS
jgi:hypothetical protein